MTKTLNRTVINRIALAVVFLALVYSLSLLPFAEWTAVVVEWVQQHPIAGPLAYIVCVIIATVLMAPGSGSLMIAGFLFGLIPGFLFAAIAIIVGAQGAFLTGRIVARQWVEKKVAANKRLRAIEKGLQEEAFLIVALTRLSMIIPFSVLNYGYGITSVRPWTHLSATAVGILPAVALYVYLGTLARDLGQILSGESTPSDFGYWIAAAGITAFAVLTWAIHRMASRALARHLPSLETDNAD